MPEYCSCYGKFVWPNSDPAGSQLGAEALKSRHGLHILGIDAGPCIIVLVNIASSMFSKLDHFIMSNSDVTLKNLL
jgi:hypothetical protein